MQEEEMKHAVGKLYLKTTEILSMMKNGEFIVAYEKLGGVQKILAALGGELQRKPSEQKSAVSSVESAA